MTIAWQRILLIAAALGVLAVLAAIVQQVLASQPGAQPARVVQTDAGPYHLRVSLYTYPAHAGLSLPYAIAATEPVGGTLRYTVTAVPGEGVDATPINASFAAIADTKGAIRGSVEITVRGSWWLHIQVDGPRGSGYADVPFTATAPAAIPFWLSWLIGLVPAVGAIAFFLSQRRRQVAPAAVSR